MIAIVERCLIDYVVDRFLPYLDVCFVENKLAAEAES
jgi:hypothetical protein